jgi:hypothetical protein
MALMEVNMKPLSFKVNKREREVNNKGNLSLARPAVPVLETLLEDKHGGREGERGTRESTPSFFLCCHIMTRWQYRERRGEGGEGGEGRWTVFV